MSKINLTERRLIRLHFILIVIFFIILLGLIGIKFAGAFRINEVMYNPIGSDNNREYVEIKLDYNDNVEDLVNYKIGDSDSRDALELLVISNLSDYALIVEYEYDLSLLDTNVTVFSAGSTIGNSLNNVNDCIFLYDNNSDVIDSMCYDGSIANDNDMSIEYYNNSWFESVHFGGSPGEENSVIEYFYNLSFVNSQTNNTNNANASIKVNQTNEEDGNTSDGTGEGSDGICQNTICRDDYISSVEILEVNSDDSEVDFNKLLNVRLAIEKENDRKTVTYIYVYDEEKEKKVSQEQKVYLFDKYSRVELIIYIPFKKYSCSSGFYPNDLTLVVEGLGDRDTYDLNDFDFVNYCTEKTECKLDSKTTSPEKEIVYISTNGAEEVKGKVSIEEENFAKNDYIEINSLYSRAKKFNEKINLFSNIEFKDIGEYNIHVKANEAICFEETISINEPVKKTLNFSCSAKNNFNNNYEIGVESGSISDFQSAILSYDKTFGIPLNNSKEATEKNDYDEDLVFNFSKNKQFNNARNKITGNLVSDISSLKSGKSNSEEAVNENISKLEIIDSENNIIYDEDQNTANKKYLYGIVVIITIAFIGVFYKMGLFGWIISFFNFR